VEQVGRLPGGEPGALVRGVARARIGAGTTGPGGAFWVEVTVVPDVGSNERAQELAREYKGLVVSVLQQRGAWQLIDGVQRLTDPSAVADTAGYASYLGAERKLTLLETTDLIRRLELAIGWAREHLAELNVAETIRKDVQEGVDRQQRELLLRQQMAAVRKELRELQGGTDAGDEPADLRSRVESTDLPDHVREAALREVDKLERTSEQFPGTGWIWTWLDTVLEVPWSVRTQDAYDIPVRGRCSMPTTPAWTRSRSGSPSTWRCASGARSAASASSGAGAAAPCSRWSAPQGSARPAWESPWPARWAASSSAWRWAASGTRRRSAVTGGPTSGRCPGGSCGR
jgi:ATP-dependent Lon protease